MSPASQCDSFVFTPEKKKEKKRGKKKDPTPLARMFPPMKYFALCFVYWFRGLLSGEADHPCAEQDTKLALVHIPLPLYPHFIQPIIQLLAIPNPDRGHNQSSKRPWAFAYPFANVSITSIECSIVCPRHLVQTLFLPILDRLDEQAKQNISISKDDFLVIQIGGEGMDAGQRVLDLTAPLALAGMYVKQHDRLT